ncbi:MAG: hypothetical protein HON94_15125, partial [Methylococcales bacterium]|nr:hypothetical protein [Methylococcales bacterium]
MVNELILAWNNKVEQQWLPVGRLKKEGDTYLFQYTNGISDSFKNGTFSPFVQLDDIHQIYYAKELFPLFQNRLLQKSRPEHDDFLNWINLDKNNYSDFDELALTGGIRATDSLQLFPIPEKKGDLYKVMFFS